MVQVRGSHERDKMADSELLEQQQLMIEQLKALIRQRDSDLERKDKELQETNTKLSKMRLQNKAKQAKMSKMEEAKKGQAEEAEKVCVCVCGMSLKSLSIILRGYGGSVVTFSV